MSKITDAEANATSLDGLVNDNALVPTLRNGPKPSYQYLVDGWDAEIAAAILEMNKSRGFRVVGTFADGFTYELFNDVGIDTDGNSWIYVGAGAPNKVVAAGTVPSVGAGYEQVTFNVLPAQNVTNTNGGNVQDFINLQNDKNLQSPVDVSEFGVDYSIPSNTANLKAALESGANELVFSDVVKIDAVLTVALAGNIKLSGIGGIEWAGAATTDFIIYVDCNGFDFEYDINTNGKNLAAAGWRITSNLPMNTPKLPRAVIKGSSEKFSATLAGTSNNSNLMLDGSYRCIDVCDGEHKETSRADIDNLATQTVVVTRKDGELYAKKVNHYNNTYSGIVVGSTETNDEDSDYFTCFTLLPSEFNSGYGDAVVESHSNTYLNPIGRCEKFQCFAHSHDNNVVRNGDEGSRNIHSRSVDFNFQFGAGISENQNITLLGQTTSPLTTSYTPVSFYQGADYGEDRGIAVNDGLVINNYINPALKTDISTLSDFSSNAASAQKPFGSHVAKNIMMVGGSVSSVALTSSSTGAAGSLVLDNITASVDSTILSSQSSCIDVIARLSNIINTSGSDVDFNQDSVGGVRYFEGKAFANGLHGVKQNYVSGISGANTGGAPMLAGAALSDPNFKNDGGSMSVQSKLIDDDGEHKFEPRGFVSGECIVFISTNFSGYSGTFALTGAGAQIKELNSTLPASFELGVGVNPNVDGKINCWVDSTGSLNISNRLGSGRRFTVGFLG